MLSSRDWVLLIAPQAESEPSPRFRVDAALPASSPLIENEQSWARPTGRALAPLPLVAAQGESPPTKGGTSVIFNYGPPGARAPRTAITSIRSAAARYATRIAHGGRGFAQLGLAIDGLFAAIKP
jgi:hypothetical protein